MGELSVKNMSKPKLEKADVPLTQALAGGHYRIISYNADARTRNKLETMGLICTGSVQVVSNTAAGLILQVKNSRLAMGKELARMIAVRQEPAWK